MDGDIMIHDINTGEEVLSTKVLGPFDEKVGNTCYCVRHLNDESKFMSTHED